MAPDELPQACEEDFAPQGNFALRALSGRFFW